MLLSRRNFKVLHPNYNKILAKWIPIGHTRMKSTAKPKTKTYSHTILFPKTDFPARSNSAKKDEIQKTAMFSELYNWQRENLTGPEFVLHDGPPYANGDLHIGHAVNKIIKDINNRSQLLQGNKVHYIPGWDCHGLPIELKALQRAKKVNKNEPTDPVEIRKIAREFALETVEKQKEQFKSWGIMADWDKQYYKTLDNSYVKKQLDLFYEMFELGLIFRALKPVYWSPASKTALAEAELVYDPQFKSTEAYVSFPLDVVPEGLKHIVKGEPISAVIWTTTPWTLVANRAICYNPQLAYCAARLAGLPGLFLLARDALRPAAAAIGRAASVVAEVEGHALLGGRYHHELLGRSFPLLGAAHVSAAGAGLVHTAPAHGHDDFLVGLQHGIPVECNVDESGVYRGLGRGLDGLAALGAGAEAVLARLAPRVLRRGLHAHAYPLDWRTGTPVIVRASHQWFIDTEKLKADALAALEGVRILPAATAAQSRQGFRARVQARRYWCVSRQRAWGVPLPALYHRGAPVVDRRIIDRLCSLLETAGPDAWWTCDVTDLLPGELADELGLDPAEVTKGQDIMDIWLDSGASWRAACPGAPAAGGAAGAGGAGGAEAGRAGGAGGLEAGGAGPAALCGEGLDQLTGWFQSSLLTSVAVAGRAPYRCIFVHGFVVDGARRKMSKSLGNALAPETLIHGDKRQPGYGLDTLRWWVASHGTQHTQIIVSEQLLADCQAEAARLRAVLRYLLGVIDLPPPSFRLAPPLSYLDRYILAETNKFVNDVNECMRELRFNNAVQQILYFVSNKVSALYCHCVKDRLYCAPKDSDSRLSAQLVAHTILISLCKTVGPILPHLIEEVWRYHPLYEKPFFFTQNIPVLAEECVDTSTMDVVLDLKKDICNVAKNDNLKRYSVHLKVNPALYDDLDEWNRVDELDESALCEILEVSAVSLVSDASVGRWLVSVAESARDQCLRCRKYNALENSDKCLRCEKAVAQL